MHVLRAYLPPLTYNHSFTHSLLQPGDIVCSALPQKEVKEEMFVMLSLSIEMVSDKFVSIMGTFPGGGDSHMKQTGMLVVSLRGVNFGFWSRLGCSGQSTNILCHQGLV